MRRHLKSLVLAGTVAVTALTGVAASTGVAHAGTIGACANIHNDGNCDGAQVQIGDACWDSAAPLSQVPPVWYKDQGYSFETQLWWSKLCQSNFAVTTVIGTGALAYQVSDKVRRHPEPGVSYQMEHGAWITMFPWSTGAQVISPLVYSPGVPAQACISTRADDQVLCTVYF